MYHGMKRRFIIASIAVVCICCIIVYFLYGLLPKEYQIIGGGDCCYHATIYLQPYDNFTQKEAKRMKADLDKHLGEILDGAFPVCTV